MRSNIFLLGGIVFIATGREIGRAGDGVEKLARRAVIFRDVLELLLQHGAGRVVGDLAGEDDADARVVALQLLEISTARLAMRLRAQ